MWKVHVKLHVPENHVSVYPTSHLSRDLLMCIFFIWNVTRVRKPRDWLVQISHVNIYNNLCSFHVGFFHLVFKGGMQSNKLGRRCVGCCSQRKRQDWLVIMKVIKVFQVLDTGYPVYLGHEADNSQGGLSSFYTARKILFISMVVLCQWIHNWLYIWIQFTPLHGLGHLHLLSNNWTSNFWSLQLDPNQRWQEQKNIYKSLEHTVLPSLPLAEKRQTLLKWAVSKSNYT